MRRSSILGHAIEVLDLLQKSRSPVDQLVRDFFRSRHYLGSHDRQAVSALVYGTVRNFLLVHSFARAALVSGSAPFPRVPPSAVLLSAYALRIAGENPDTFCTDIESVWRVMAPDLDPVSVIRALTEVPSPVSLCEHDAERLALEHSIPAFIVAEWVRRFGIKEATSLCLAMNEQAPTTLRVNALKADRLQMENQLRERGVGVRSTPHAPDGLILDRRIDIQGMPAFREGWFEMQDEGSQILSLLLDPRPGERILDACAGAGGKSLHMAAMMANKGEILALDVDRKRLRELEERRRRAGASIIRTGSPTGDGEGIEKFDAVLIDAPCTGSGTLRRNPGLKLRLTPAFVVEAVATQSSLLSRYCRFVRPGGRLLYATCSLLEAENEAQVEAFLSRHPEFVRRPFSDPVQRILPHPSAAPGEAMLLPHRHGTDGFFAALLENRSAD